MAVWEPILKSASCIKKLEKPILTKADVPYEAELVFNAGVAKIDGKYVMAFRNDYGTNKERYENEGKRFDGTSVGVAVSDNGVDGWKYLKSRSSTAAIMKAPRSIVFMIRVS